MDRKTYDDIVFKLKEVMEYYNKTIEDRYLKMWVDKLRHHNPEHILYALDHYIEIGKYSPKIADILDIIREKESENNWKNKYENYQSLPPCNCDPKIATAWTTYMKAAFGYMMPGQDADMDIDEALTIVNQQASKHNQPDAILDKHKLAEYWP